MNKLKPVGFRSVRWLYVGITLLAALLYIWQTVDAWASQVRTEQLYASLGNLAAPPSRGMGTTTLGGVGIAQGASGTITFYLNRGRMGTLLLHDMPTLPASQLYALWCIDEQGRIALSSIFRIPPANQGSTIVSASAPQMQGAYRRFFITIEPTENHISPTGMVVMLD